MNLATSSAALSPALKVGDIIGLGRGLVVMIHSTTVDFISTRNGTITVRLNDVSKTDLATMILCKHAERGVR